MYHLIYLLCMIFKWSLLFIEQDTDNPHVTNDPLAGILPLMGAHVRQEQYNSDRLVC